MILTNRWATNMKMEPAKITSNTLGKTQVNWLSAVLSNSNTRRVTRTLITFWRLSKKLNPRIQLLSLQRNPIIKRWNQRYLLPISYFMRYNKLDLRVAQTMFWDLKNIKRWCKKWKIMIKIWHSLSLMLKYPQRKGRASALQNSKQIRWKPWAHPRKIL